MITSLLLRTLASYFVDILFGLFLINQHNLFPGHYGANEWKIGVDYLRAYCKIMCRKIRFLG